MTGKHCAPHCGHNNFEISTPDGCPGFFLIEIAEEKASFFACPDYQLYVFYTAAVKLALANTLQLKRVTIFAFSVSVGHGHW